MTQNVVKISESGWLVTHNGREWHFDSLVKARAALRVFAKHGDHDQSSHGAKGSYKMDVTGSKDRGYRIEAKNSDGKSVGHMLVRFDGEIRNVAVNPEERRKGVATAMWEHAKRLAETEGFPAPKHSSNQTGEGAAWAEVAKHGNHDQSSHANRGPKEAGLSPEIQAAVKENGGLTISLVDGSQPDSGFVIGLKPTKWGEVVDAEDFYDPVKGKKILADYMIRHKERLLGATKTTIWEGTLYLGVWHNSKNGKVYLDVAANNPSRVKALMLGRLNDQISIWDVVRMEEIPTGGTGKVSKNGTSEQQSSAGFVNSAEFYGDERRRNSRLGIDGVGAVDANKVSVEFIRFV